ncbi:glycosyltransferase [Pediococcus acidilactici]|uniref:glycosyltransferase n=1 Tax=Pediococcus acidilactici TaxID=1254 RepID=UPI001BD69CFA|nr:glycosyltransferase [Pediococcus acidilactici]MBS9398425.1 glycosyltransferase [Pediococcus acidilactici]
MKDKKQIWIVGGMIKGVGISQYIFNTYKYMQNKHGENIQLTFINESGKHDYDKEFSDLGWKMVYISPWKENPLLYFWQWFNLLRKNHKYINIIHFHYDQLSKFWPFLVLKFYRVKNIIVHSHNSANSDMSKRKFMMFSHKLGKKILSNMKIYRLAVSTPAGKWLFDSSAFKIIKNGINTKKFRFDEEKRGDLRKRFDINNDTYVFGNIGRFKEQKNHRFLIELFKKVLEVYPESKLVLVGIGPLEEEIKRYTSELGIQKSILFVGLRDNIPDFLSMFDMLLFPSLYEGFPIALVEAQANGAPIVYSNTITNEIEITNEIVSAKLNDKNDWLNKIKCRIEKKSNFNKRKSDYKVVKEAGYDIGSESEKLYDFYVNLIG